MLTDGADGHDGGVGRQTSLSISAPNDALHPPSQFTHLLNAWKILPIAWINPEGKLAMVTEQGGRGLREAESFEVFGCGSDERGRSPGRIWRITSRSALQQRDSHCLQTLSIQACQRPTPRSLHFVVCCIRDGPEGWAASRRQRNAAESCPGASSSGIANSHKKIKHFCFQPDSVTVTGSFLSP